MQIKKQDKTKAVLIGVVPVLVVLIIALIIAATVPLITITYSEPYTDTETYDELVPYTEAEIQAWADLHTPPAKMVSVDSLSTEEILDILSGKNNPEIPPMTPRYETKSRAVVKYREVQEKVTVFQYFLGDNKCKWAATL